MTSISHIIPYLRHKVSEFTKDSIIFDTQDSLIKANNYWDIWDHHPYAEGLSGLFYKTVESYQSWMSSLWCTSDVLITAALRSGKDFSQWVYMTCCFRMRAPPQRWSTKAGQNNGMSKRRVSFFFNNGMSDYWAIGCFPMGIFRVIERSEQWSVGEMTWRRTDSCLLKTSFPNTAWVWSCWWRKEVSRWL